jgi:hypothetical protein
VQCASLSCNSFGIFPKIVSSWVYVRCIDPSVSAVLCGSRTWAWSKETKTQRVSDRDANIGASHRYGRDDEDRTMTISKPCEPTSASPSPSLEISSCGSKSLIPYAHVGWLEPGRSPMRTAELRKPSVSLDLTLFKWALRAHQSGNG